MTQKKHPTIALTPVKASSQVHSIGYDPATNTLAVKFSSGGLYHYSDVPQAKFDAMRKADSVGSYLGKYIKPAHEFTKIDAA